ncbi:uncharacterized protein LOC119726812 [Patiria miniata]|uniref:Peptidase C51 domain-containing protein n=1 Tax=Patiria miniata TaxID=46514 RepID=A0A913ZTR7_PATMI|nr:uncharacterized protein LOC119726812 [Patiria miniata]
MKFTSAVLLVLLGAFYFHGAEAVTGSTIAQVARGYTGSTVWSFVSSHRTGRNTNKCNIFVAEVLEEAGATVPHRWPRWLRWSPVGAGEWGNRYSSYLSEDRCWTYSSTAGLGYVAGDGRHVAIVTGTRQTTSARSDMVVTNDFGFRSSQEGSIIFWKYTC